MDVDCRGSEWSRNCWQFKTSGVPSRSAKGKLRVVTSETADALWDLLVEIFFAGLIYRQQNQEAE